MTFEGIDGCGKSTQLEMTAEYLTQLGHPLKKLREPGSTELSEKIRAILLDNNSDMTDVTELFLYEAARAEITAKEIAPLLDKGISVLCDRFYDSTTAYQGYGRGLDIRMVKMLHRLAVGEIQPDLTFLINVDLKTASRRVGLSKDRLESLPASFHRRVRNGFLEIARKEKRRVKIIDGQPSAATVFASVKKYLDKKLPTP